ncbi:fungal-specific transcription factor domain-domain-containing protein [Aspergillus taichungensis]|uniref:Fungal-specific transcription factor domain-domain-containing protein n=1 Tax=Aspergillus taichungensis TaxID=482145 RepID=A0A2J5I1B2_9EURO|nr:fungal-specific transcription factor domain-domain-containing protein [Aspergillus taichungensis]
MSHPSPQKNGGNSIPPPKQIRFVSTDGQPQTKRRRVNAACRTCRKRKIRCSGEQPVCRTCSDYNHECLGYSDQPPSARPQPEVASKSPTMRTLPDPSEPGASRKNTQVESGPSNSPSRNAPPPPIASIEKSFESTNLPEIQNGSVSRDMSRTTKESEQQTTGETPESSRTSLSSGARTHVPYFRYFGPTAIVPGFKQMVVQVRGSRRSNPSQSSESLSPLRSPKPTEAGVNLMNAFDNRDARDANTIPFYDRDDSLPVSNLVMHLCELFFAHLGCNFPFLQRERFFHELKEKKVDTMLVDAVCALSARFSPHPLLSPPQAPSIDGSEPPVDVKKYNRGQSFAQRAISALVASLSCPTLSVVQACLLLAYERFGSNHDSGLWMYLGIAIRMAQDLGMQKPQGLKYNYGQSGVAPNTVMTGQAGKFGEDQYGDLQVPQSPAKKAQSIEDRRAWERGRVDTFWSIFFLDRVISSGTGRPVTLRDEDIELCFPTQSESQLSNGWPAPFPPLIRIIHLYGRVTDLINGIQAVNHVTTETLKMLAGMESDLTGIYQRLSPRLHFNAANFQAYVKAKEGTNFILLHFWFHTLIVLLHQPTLLNSFGGTIQHLYPNSRELSMSSAKTIADILSFSELVDGKSFIGNPFTSQPMYIAACAFLMESAYYTSPSSGSGSPPSQPLFPNQTSNFVLPTIDCSGGTERKATAKHILLASAAKDNYQRCYKALKALETYWEGTKYIITVLDQKAKGIVDPLLYTVEEMENTAEMSTMQPFPGPHRRGIGASLNAETSAVSGQATPDTTQSPRVDPGQAIGWALTGAINSSQPNLSLLYQMPAAPSHSAAEKPTFPSQHSHSYANLSVPPGVGQVSGSYSQPVDAARTTVSTPNTSIAAAGEKYPGLVPSGRVSTSDANLLLGLNATYPTTRSHPSGAQSRYSQDLPSTSGMGGQPATYGYHMPAAAAEQSTSGTPMGPEYHTSFAPRGRDVLIESQDIDMATLQQQDQLPFALGGDILPWLEYLPPDVLSYFGEHQHYPTMMNSHDSTPRPPP